MGMTALHERNRLWTTPDPLPEGDPFQQYIAALMRWIHAHRERVPDEGRCGVMQYMQLHECLSPVIPATDWWPVSYPFHMIPLYADNTLPDWGYTFLYRGVSQ